MISREQYLKVVASSTYGTFTTAPEFTSPSKNFLLIKDLPGYKSGCIFTLGDNYIYYISYDPERKGFSKIDGADDYLPERDSLLRFNIHQMESNPEWFKKVDNQYIRDLKIDELI